MRYALCLHGMASGTTDIGNKVDWSGAYPYFEKNVLRPDVDVFCHTWEKEGLDFKKLVEAYKPVASICEPQKEFPGCPETKSIYSRWYSAHYSAYMAVRHMEDQLPMVYDGVLLARYDVVFRVNFPWDKLDTHSFWTPGWRQKPAPNSGYLDYWFYGSPHNMIWLTSMYREFDSWFARGLKQNGHSVVGKRIPEMTDEHGRPIKINKWGEQPEDFILLRRLLGATN